VRSKTLVLGIFKTTLGTFYNRRQFCMPTKFTIEEGGSNEGYAKFSGDVLFNSSFDVGFICTCLC
jgi:hypothetical protein